MDFTSIKQLAVTSAVALTLFSGINSAQAQVTSQIEASISTAAALASAPVSNMDFGTWAINVGGTDSFSIQLAPVTTGAPAVPSCGGVTHAQSVCINTVPPATGGVVSVTSPAPTTLEIQGVISANFVGASFMTLGSLTYRDTVVTPSGSLPTTYSASSVATTTVGGTPENIGIGGTVTITGGTPAASTTFASPRIDVSFRY